MTKGWLLPKPEPLHLTEAQKTELHQYFASQVIMTEQGLRRIPPLRKVWRYTKPWLFEAVYEVIEDEKGTKAK